jgi:hypothetical protein
MLHRQAKRFYRFISISYDLKNLYSQPFGTTPAIAHIQNALRDARTTFLTCRINTLGRGSPRDGGAAETLAARRGAVRFAFTAGIFSATYERWSSRIFRSLTE